MKRIADFLEKEQLNQEVLENQRFLVEHKGDPEMEKELESFFNSLEPEKMPDSRSLGTRYCQLTEKLGIRGRWLRSKAASSILTWGTRIAAVIAIPLMVAVGLLLSSQKQPAEWNEMYVPFGQTRTVALADGSTMTLNSGSRLIYPSEFQGKERKVFLNGEVSAVISKDPEKPFIIQSGEQSVLVHGTSFDFKNYESSECTELFLKDGSVSFGYSCEDAERLVRLSPGEMLQLDKENGKLEIDRFSTENFKSFNEDRSIRFNNLKVSDIAKDLERIFDVKIIVNDEKLANTRYLAYFTNHESLEQILKAISDNNRKIKVERKDGVIYLSLRR